MIRGRDMDEFDQNTVPLGKPEGHSPAADEPARLIIMSEDLHGKVVELDATGLRIGRQEDNDLVLGSGPVSRHHARIVREDGAYLFEDLKSYNGSTCNGSVVPPHEPRQLRHQDILTICDYQMLFVHAGDAVGGLDLSSIQLDHGKISAEAEEALRDFLGQG